MKRRAGARTVAGFDCRVIARCWTKARKGARPVPAQYMIRGVVDWVVGEGRRKGQARWAVAVRLMVSWRESPEVRVERYVDATPSWAYVGESEVFLSLLWRTTV